MMKRFLRLDNYHLDYLAELLALIRLTRPIQKSYELERMKFFGLEFLINNLKQKI